MEYFVEKVRFRIRSQKLRRPHPPFQFLARGSAEHTQVLCDSLSVALTILELGSQSNVYLAEQSLRSNCDFFNKIGGNWNFAALASNVSVADKVTVGVDPASRKFTFQTD